MKNLDTQKTNAAPMAGGPEAKRPFVEPQISDPVEVVKGNPAADCMFAVAGSGTGP